MSEMLYGIKGGDDCGRAVHLGAGRVSDRAEGARRGAKHACVGAPTRPDNVAFSRRNIAKAMAAGLTFRPLAVTAKDTLDWNKTRTAAELRRLAEGKARGDLGAA